MQRLLTSASLLLATAMLMAVETPNPVLVGRWRVKLDAVSKDTAVRMGLPEPVAEFTFNPDMSFSYLAKQGATELVKKGRYGLDGSKVLLNNSDLSGFATLSGGALDYNGMSFARVVEYNVVGDWVLSRGVLLDTSIKVSFRKDGTFEFRSSNAISKGKYTLNGPNVNLVWTEVDGDRVTEGQMKKTLMFDEDGTGFFVDQWRYVRKQ